MRYTVEEINNGVAKVRYPDGSWAEIVMEADMDQDALDQAAWDFKPKVGVAPDFVSEGQSRTATAPPVIEEETVTEPEWLTNRKNEYGKLESQLEYITENGLSAWQSYVATVKAKYPKPADE